MVVKRAKKLQQMANLISSELESSSDSKMSPMGSIYSDEVLEPPRAIIPCPTWCCVNPQDIFSGVFYQPFQAKLLYHATVKKAVSLLH